MLDLLCNQYLLKTQEPTYVKHPGIQKCLTVKRWPQRHMSLISQQLFRHVSKLNEIFLASVISSSQGAREKFEEIENADFAVCFRTHHLFVYHVQIHHPIQALQNTQFLPRFNTHAAYVNNGWHCYVNNDSRKTLQPSNIHLGASIKPKTNIA